VIDVKNRVSRGGVEMCFANKRLPYFCGLVAIAFALGVTGCNVPKEDAATVALREKFVTGAAPESPMTLTEVAEKLKASAGATESLEVTVVGRIFAGELEPWENGKASFVLSELPAEGHGAGHDADNCPFCKRRAAKAPTGIVKFVDDKKETISIDARTLFNVTNDQRVAIHGTAIAGEFGSLVLIASQMYIYK